MESDGVWKDGDVPHRCGAYIEEHLLLDGKSMCPTGRDDKGNFIFEQVGEVQPPKPPTVSWSVESEVAFSYDLMRLLFGWEYVLYYQQSQSLRGLEAMA